MPLDRAIAAVNAYRYDRVQDTWIRPTFESIFVPLLARGPQPHSPVELAGRLTIDEIIAHMRMIEACAEAHKQGYP